MSPCLKREKNTQISRLNLRNQCLGWKDVLSRTSLLGFLSESHAIFTTQGFSHGSVFHSLSKCHTRKHLPSCPWFLPMLHLEAQLCPQRSPTEELSFLEALSDKTKQDGIEHTVVSGYLRSPSSSWNKWEQGNCSLEKCLKMGGGLEL